MDESSNFSRIYTIYFPKMMRFAKEYVMDDEEAKNIVQDLFLYLWERRDMLETIHNLNAYLFMMIKNRCIDFYRQQTKTEFMKESLDSIHQRELDLKMEALQEFDENMLTANDVEMLIENAINNLPEKCRNVFIMSRMDGLKYDQIAQTLNISVNTVQNHMVTALRKLKNELKDYLPLFIFLI